MVTGHQARRFTIDDYDQLPDDGPRYELIDGVLIEIPAPTILHQRLLKRFLRDVDQFVEDAESGEVFFAPCDVQLPRGTIVQPDMLFVSNTHREVVTEKRIVGAPDLVVEISSPSTMDRDLGDKRELYRKHGVAEYWFIDVEERTASVWTLRDGEYVVLRPDVDGLIRSTVVTGFAVDIERVFADADRQR